MLAEQKDVCFIGYPQEPNDFIVDVLVQKLRAMNKLVKCKAFPLAATCFCDPHLWPVKETYEEDIPYIHKDMVRRALKKAFHDYKGKIISLGTTLKVQYHILLLILTWKAGNMERGRVGQA